MTSLSFEGNCATFLPTVKFEFLNFEKFHLHNVANRLHNSFITVLESYTWYVDRPNCSKLKTKSLNESRSRGRCFPFQKHELEQRSYIIYTINIIFLCLTVNCLPTSTVNILNNNL